LMKWGWRFAPPSWDRLDRPHCIFLENRYRILAGNICLEGKTSAANTRKTLI